LIYDGGFCKICGKKQSTEKILENINGENLKEFATHCGNGAAMEKYVREK